MGLPSQPFSERDLYRGMGEVLEGGVAAVGSLSNTGTRGFLLTRKLLCNGTEKHGVKLISLLSKLVLIEVDQSAL